MIDLKSMTLEELTAFFKEEPYTFTQSTQDMTSSTKS